MGFCGEGLRGEDSPCCAQNPKSHGTTKDSHGNRGIRAGIAFFEPMGEENGLVNISAIGDEVNTAARITSEAAAGKVLVSESALKDAGIDGSQLESRKLKLKGITGFGPRDAML